MDQNVKYLSEKSQFINELFYNDEKLLEELNKIPNNILKKLITKYKDTKDLPIVNLRKDLLRLLINKNSNIDNKVFLKLINDHKKNNLRAFKSWTNNFRIFHPLILENIREDIEEKLYEFLNSFKPKIDKFKQLKLFIVDFYGAQQQGNDRIWIALYNKQQPSQSTSNQFFFEFKNDKVTYGFYSHYNEQYITKKIEHNYSSFNINDLIYYFNQYNYLIFNDTLPTNKEELNNLLNLYNSETLNQYLSIIKYIFKKNNVSINNELIALTCYKSKLILSVRKKEILVLNLNGKYLVKRYNDGRMVYKNNDNIIENIIELNKTFEDEINNELLHNKTKGSNKIFTEFIFNEVMTDSKYDSILDFYDGINRKYYKFAPGSNAKFWDEFYKNGIVAVGYNELDIKNLEEVKSYEELQNKYPDQKNTNQLWNIWLLKDSKVNDVVFANKGRNEVIGIGVFEEGKYFYEPNHEYHHQRKINWITNKQLDFKDIIESKTLFRPDTFSPTLNHELILIKYLEKYPELEDTFIKYNLIESVKLNNNTMKDNKNNCLNFTKNQILYGPPGTGKTYNTVRLAVQILDCLKDLPDYNAETINKYNQYKKDGRLSFITFHQNFSYEDFIQGLRPDPNSEEGMKFIKSDGIFKEIANRAESNLKNFYSRKKQIKNFEDAFNDFTDELGISKSEIKVKMSSGAEFKITDVSSNSIYFDKPKGKSKHTLSISTLKDIVTNKSIIDKGLAPYYNPLAEEIRNIMLINEENVSYQSYVIIIDEINRANISRVFGELITLIEDDKRWSGDPEKVNWQVTLPSGDPFVIPDNLYIIGTMNTADKSIALLDVALRRRFNFKAMYPLYHGEKGINYKNVCYSDYLKNLNELIVKEIGDGRGHDLQIGHSYFMGISNNQEFIDTMNDKVIPLITEYFMNNVDDVRELIKSSFEKEVCNVNFEIIAKSYPIAIQMYEPNKDKSVGLEKNSIQEIEVSDEQN